MAWKSVVAALLIPLLKRIELVKPIGCWWHAAHEA